MSCSTNIVECLRKEGVNPEAIDTQCLPGYIPNYGIAYNTQNYFQSPADPNDTWTLDFKRTVFITGYQIYALEDTNWVRNWDFLVKKQGNWVLLESHQNNNPPGSSVHTLSQPQNTRFVKLKGGTTWTGGKYLSFYYIKFFGYSTKIDLQKGEATCKTMQRPTIFLHFVFLMLLHS